ncbi:hypothetical protein GBA52_018566 [Prunus armeniaca]|nr:hypothetical protein GBA52_018566 [Prunus armeniaca]
MCENNPDQTARPCNVNGLPEIIVKPQPAQFDNLRPDNRLDPRRKDPRTTSWPLLKILGLITDRFANV